MPQYYCTECNTEIDEGDFIAILGQAPASGLSTPIGRADKLFHDVGQIYCADCLKSVGAETLVDRVEHPRQAERS